MSARRILLLADNPYVGGITSYLHSVLTALAQDDRFELITASFPGRGGDRTLIVKANEAGASVHVIPMAWNFDPRVVKTFRRFLAREEIDLIHAQGYRATLISLFGAGSIPVMTTCHGMAVAPALRTRLWEWARLRAMRRHPLTIACSDFVRGWLLDKGFPEDRVRTIYNCYAPSGKAPGNGATRESLGIEEASLVALYVGRLVAGKGLDTLFRALAGRPGIAPVVVGDGPLREALEKEADALGVKACFVGGTQDPTPFYALADVVVLPSKMEALPMTLIEAAAHGRPAVATRVGGIPEVVRDGKSGILVAPGAVEELGEALARLKEPELRARLGAEAKEVWCDAFTPERMAGELGQAYRDVLES